MFRFLIFLLIIAGALVLVKPELITIAKQEMHMRERTNQLIENSTPVSINEGIAALQENYPNIDDWTFNSVTEDVGSIIYAVTDKAVFDIAKYKTEHDVQARLQANKNKATTLLCADDTILNLLAHQTIRAIYVQYYDRQGIDFGRSIIDNADCQLWPFSLQRVLENAF